MNNDCLLVITLHETGAEALAEWLLVNCPENTFTSLPAFGHGTHLQGASVAEQIQARVRQIQFQIHIPRTAVEALLARVDEAFPGLRRDVWCMPLLPLAGPGA